MKRIFLRLYKFSRSIPYPAKWLDNVAEIYKNPENSSWLEDFSCKAYEELNYILGILNKYAEKINNLQDVEEIEIAKKELQI